MAVTLPNSTQYIEASSENNQEHGLMTEYNFRKSRLYAAIQHVHHPVILEKSMKVYDILSALPLDDINDEDLTYVNSMMAVTQQLLLSNPGSERLKLLLLHQNLIMLAPGYFLSPTSRFFLINYSKLQLTLSAVIFISTMVSLASGTAMLGFGLTVFGLFSISGLAQYACSRHNARDQSLQNLNDCIKNAAF